MRSKLRMAVIGCGHWGGNYVRLLSELPAVDLIAICDASEENLQNVGVRYPNLKRTTSVDDLIANYPFDAAIVSTNAATHYSIARRLLEADKHVLVEKPMTTRAEHAKELIELAETQGLTLMVGHVFLYNAGIEKVRSYFASGEIGDIHYLYSRRTNLGPIRHDANVLWDLAAHDISIFNYWLGECPIWVSAVGADFLQSGIEDVGFLSMGYPDGVLGHIHVSWADPHKERVAVAVGGEQRVVFDDIAPQLKVVVYKKGIAASSMQGLGLNGVYQIALRDGDVFSPRLELVEPLRKQVIHFLECVDQGTKPLTDGWNGLDVVRAIEAASLSIKQNGTPVSIGCS